MSSKHAKRYIAIISCLLFISGFAYIGTLRTAKSHADTITTHGHQFYIVGTKIIDPDGKVFIPIGANVGSQPNNFDWAGGAAGQSAAALAWGWNTVRLNVDCTTAESYSRVNAKDGDKVLLSDIAKIVDEYTAKKIVVMVECHDVQKNLNDAAVFWTDMANKYKSNPYVWFNYANEPEWADNDAWITEQKQWLALIRSTGAENIFIADAMNTGNDAGWAGAKRIYDPSMGPALAAGQCNVLMSLHNYGGMANSTDNVMRVSPFETYWSNVQAAGLAMIIGEYGMNYQLAFQTQANGSVKVVAADGVSDPKKIAGDAYNHMALGVYSTDNIAKNYGIGMLVWHATFADGNIIASPPNGTLGKPNFYNVLNDAKTGVKSGFSFTQMGSDLWNNGHAKPAAAAFGGDYAKSNCGSVGSVTVSPPASPIVTKPIGSTPSVADKVTGQAARFGITAHTADPALISSYAAASPAKSKVVSSTTTGAVTVDPTVPAGTDTTPTTSAPVQTSKTALTPAKRPVTKTTTKRPTTLFSLAGKSINTQQVGYIGGGSFTAVLALIVGFHVLDIWRSRRLYAADHDYSKEKTSPMASPERPVDATTSPPGSDPAQPGDVVKPRQ